MNETTRTLTFVGVAAFLLAAAFGMHAATQPASLTEFSDVNSEFYPQFKEPRDATSLRVAAYNEDAARVDVFSVEFKNGMWRIPSHHNYPADGEERLAKTATSIIGLEREALVSTSADDHKRLGVLDPLNEELTGTEGRGDRITLKKGDVVLADYIIGNKIEDGPQNTYHVRRADEDRTYRATLDLDISTRFADWIEPDLLDFRRGDLRDLVIDRYSIDETRGVLVPGDQSHLTRSSQDDPWRLEGLPDTQKVKVSQVNQIINALEDLSIVGVRPKPAGLSADLKGDGEGGGGIDTRAVFDLEQKGFFIDSRGALVSNEGDVRVAMADGVMYVLRFGEVFTGSDVEIEVGKPGTAAAPTKNQADGQKPADTQAAADQVADPQAAADSESDGTTDDAESDSLKKSRYVFITAQFDESFIDPLPQKPTKPDAPAEPAKAADQPADDDQAAVKTPEDAADADAAAGETPRADTDDAGPQPDPQADYQKALAAYEGKLKAWEQQQAAREKKIAAGQERVKELNTRFADWYYVISAKTFDNIRVSPEDLVEPAEADKTGTSAEGLPGAALPGADAAPAESPTQPQAEQPAAGPEAAPPAQDKAAGQENAEPGESGDDPPSKPKAPEASSAPDENTTEEPAS